MQNNRDEDIYSRGHDADDTGAQNGPGRALQGVRRRMLPVWVLVILDVMIVGLALNVYALFHHIIPQDPGLDGIDLPGFITAAPSTPSPAPTQTNTAATSPTVTQSPGDSTQEPSPTPTEYVDQGMWGAKFADMFTGGTIEKTDTTYRSKDINVTIRKIDQNKLEYYVVDIYIRNLINLQSGLANGKFGIGQRESTAKQAQRYNAIIAINGDNYGGRYDGVVVRNGKLYREKVYKDVLVMYNDGSMEVYDNKTFHIDQVKNSGAWQVWNFGPSLLNPDGQSMTKFDAADISGHNPRTAIGYYEPGHYCFVLVDGRSSESSGIKLPELSKIMYDLGCTVAYNLDGGQTSVMAYMGDVINKPYKGGRAISDTIYIGEIASE